MPVLRYFLFVGGVLLALLFIADTRLPRQEVRREVGNEAFQHPDIRIASTVTGPEAVTFSGQTIDYGIAQDLRVLDLAAKAADARTQAFAQASETAPQAKAAPAAKPAPQRIRKRYARHRAPPPVQQQRDDDFSWPTFNIVSGLRF